MPAAAQHKCPLDLYRGGNPNADAALLDRALDKAIVAGETVLRELVQRESRLPGEWDYLRAFQRLDTQSPPLPPPPPDGHRGQTASGECVCR
jgi:hypothetical protein